MPESHADLADHRQAADVLTQSVLVRAQGAGFAISTQVRRASLALMRRLARVSADPRQLLYAFLREFPRILRHYEPVLARSLCDAQLAGWLQGGRAVASSVLPEMGARPESRDVPSWLLERPEESIKPIVRYAIIEKAAADLAARRLVDRTDIMRLDQDARREAFTAGRAAILDSYLRVRDALTEAVVEGDSAATFRRKAGEALETGGLSPARQDMLFRNVVLRAYARGQKAVVESPLVRSAAAFAFRANIDDTRCTALCRVLSSSGLQGTGIYCVSDPTWAKVAPQSHFGCRCSTVFMPVKRAAQKGIKAAQKWLDTGKRPADEDLFVPLPDLSGIPENERLAFEAWVSPWQQP